MSADVCPNCHHPIGKAGTCYVQDCYCPCGEALSGVMILIWQPEPLSERPEPESGRIKAMRLPVAEDKRQAHMEREDAAALRKALSEPVAWRCRECGQVTTDGKLRHKPICKVIGTEIDSYDPLFAAPARRQGGAAMTDRLRKAAEALLNEVEEGTYISPCKKHEAPYCSACLPAQGLLSATELRAALAEPPIDVAAWLRSRACERCITPAGVHADCATLRGAADAWEIWTLRALSIC